LISTEKTMKRHVQSNEAMLLTRRSMLLALAGTGLAVPACEFGQLFSWNAGKPVIFGYGTAPRYDMSFHTIRLKIFKNSTFWSALPVPGLEEELTEEVMHQIEQKTPYKVDSGDADTELSGIVMSLLQSPLNFNQLNELREVETTLTCAVKWVNLRTGQLLSQPAPRVAEPPVPAGLLPGQVDPLNAPGVQPGNLLLQPLTAAPIGPGNNQATMAQQTAPPPTTGNPALGQTNLPGSPNGPPALGAGMTTPIGAVLVSSNAYYRPEIGESLATAQQTNCILVAQQIVNMMEKPW
jgi:hypothetical protein